MTDVALLEGRLDFTAQADGWYGIQRKPVHGASVDSKEPLAMKADFGWAGCTALDHDPQRVSGAWVFLRTCTLIAALLKKREDGIILTEFGDLFPGLRLEQAHMVDVTNWGYLGSVDTQSHEAVLNQPIAYAKSLQEPGAKMPAYGTSGRMEAISSGGLLR